MYWYIFWRSRISFVTTNIADGWIIVTGFASIVFVQFTGEYYLLALWETKCDNMSQYIFSLFVAILNLSPNISVNRLHKIVSKCYFQWIFCLVAFLVGCIFVKAVLFDLWAEFPISQVFFTVYHEVTLSLSAILHVLFACPGFVSFKNDYFIIEYRGPLHKH